NNSIIPENKEKLLTSIRQILLQTMPEDAKLAEIFSNHDLLKNLYKKAENNLVMRYNNKLYDLQVVTNRQNLQENVKEQLRVLFPASSETSKEQKQINNILKKIDIIAKRQQEFILSLTKQRQVALGFIDARRYIRDNDEKEDKIEFKENSIFYSALYSELKENNILGVACEVNRLVEAAVPADIRKKIYLQIKTSFAADIKQVYYLIH